MLLTATFLLIAASLIDDGFKVRQYWLEAWYGLDVCIDRIKWASVTKIMTIILIMVSVDVYGL